MSTAGEEYCRHGIAAWLAALALLVFAAPAAAQQEELQADISSHHIQIRTDFTGASVVVFGAIARDTAAAKVYDVVVVVRGPEETTVARRKQRIAGMWVNGESLAFTNVPGFYSVSSTRPLDGIAEPQVLKDNAIGFDNLPLTPDPAAGPQSAGKVEAFRAALIGLKQDQKLYRAGPDAVTFIGRSLFRTTIDLPSNVRTGVYTAGVYLFRDKKLLSTETSTITIGKAGTDQFLWTAAMQTPLLYGAASVIVAVAAGLAGAAIFRRY